jgi:hypothetical protein
MNAPGRDGDLARRLRRVHGLLPDVGDYVQAGTGGQKPNCPAGESVPLSELRQDRLFKRVPPKFLRWQNGLVQRRRFKPGEFLCREGEPGHSAFIIKRGVIEVIQGGAKPIPRTVDDVIVEMACLSSSPRNADLRALDDVEVWEVRRNVLDRMMRSPDQRGLFEQLYHERALSTALRTSELFSGLPPEDVKFLQQWLVRVRPGQTIFRQGDTAGSHVTDPRRKRSRRNRRARERGNGAVPGAGESDR